MRAALRGLQTAGWPMPGAVAAAAVAATAGILVGATLVSRDLSVPPPPDVPAVTLPARGPASDGHDLPVAVAQVAGAGSAAAINTPTAPSAPAPPPPPVTALSQPAAVATQVTVAGTQCGEPPGWARDLAAKARGGLSWSGPCPSAQGERNGWKRHGA